MQINSKHFLTMLVMAGISVAAFPAKAATITAGDLILSFRSSGTVSSLGASTDVMVDLGASSAFLTAGNNAALANIGSILASTYGDGTSGNPLWSSRSDLYWGIAAVNDTSNALSGTAADGQAHRTMYLSIADSGTLSPGTQGTTAPTIASSAYATTANSMNALKTTFAGATGTNVVTTGTGANTWSANNNAGGTNSFSLGYSAEGNFGGGTGATDLDLYKILGYNGAPSPSAGSFVGTFGINDSGVVGFTSGVTAAPEPSRALFAALGLGGLLLRRRRSLKA